MVVTILGSGTSVPLPDRSSPSLAVELDNRILALDLGPGAVRQMARAGFSHEKVGRILLTHLHPDHTADLIHFLFATRRPDVLRRRRPVVLAGARGLKAFLQRLQDAYGEWLTLPQDLLLLEEYPVDGGQEDYEEFSLTALPMDHTPSSLGYRLTDRRGRSLAYSGDTAACDELVSLCRWADLAVLESAFPEGHETEGHMTPAEAGRIAAAAGVKRLVLTHFYPEVLATDIEAQCRRAYGGELILARDLMRLEV